MPQSAEFTYSICSNCHKLNRINLRTQASTGQQPICGNCKKELPIHNEVNELDEVSFTDLIQKSPVPVVVDFWASWCQPCKAFTPVFEQAAQELGSDFIFTKINTEKNVSLSARYEIRSIPTLILFKNGKEYSRKLGALPYASLIQWLKSEGVRQAA